MHEPESAPTVGRRDVLRRTATIGAALAVTGPLVQSLGQLGAFALTSPPPGEDPGPAEVPSHFQMIVVFGTDSTRRGLKWDGAWGALHRQGNRCFDMTTHDYQSATGDQVAAMAAVLVHSTPRGYEVTVPGHLTVVDAAATFDGGRCYYAGESGGPYQVGSTWVFPKPPANNAVENDLDDVELAEEELHIEPETDVVDPELADPDVLPDEVDAASTTGAAVDPAGEVPGQDVAELLPEPATEPAGQ